MSPVSRLPRVIWWLFLVDAGLVLVHVLLHQANDWFSLDQEANLPTLYQSLKYYTFGYLAFFNVWLISFYKLLPSVYRFFWGSLGALLIFLGLDELGRIHETLRDFIPQSFPFVAVWVARVAEYLHYTGSDWVIYFVPFILGFLIAAVFWVRFAYRHYRGRLPLLLTSFALMLIVPVWEYIGSGGVGSWYPFFGVSEEYFEMTAISFLAGFVACETRTLLTNLQKVRTRESGRE